MIDKAFEEKFLSKFVEKEMYLQNPPLKTDKFIEFCQKRGVETSKKQLEFFEKEKLLFPILRIKRPICEKEMVKFKNANGKEKLGSSDYVLKEDEEEICRYNQKYYSSWGFSKRNHKLLLDWFENGNLFAPATKDFRKWSSFIGKELDYDKREIISYYSNFQIRWLRKLQKLLSISLNLAGDAIIASSNAVTETDIPISSSFSFKNLDSFEESYKQNVEGKERFEKCFNIDRKKQELREVYKHFNHMLKFLLSIQSIYYPYARSGAGKINKDLEDLRNKKRSWEDRKGNFRLETVLNHLDISIDDVSNWYRKFSLKAENLLGASSGDWIQLWKSISWNKKKKLTGTLRLGIDYLQWAIMLKKAIEEHLEKRIPDINEVSNIAPEAILKESDNENNFHHDKYERLYYLLNSFDLNYQPRVIVFVEGKTEEELFPYIYENTYGIKTFDLGIEFINIKGISKFFGGEVSIKNDNGKYDKKFISNFNHLISYNLNRWQIFPFFIGDNENNINCLLQNGPTVSIDDEQYPLPDEWKYIWGVTNSNELSLRIVKSFFL